MKESKLIFKNKYYSSELLQLHEYEFNPMNRFNVYVGMTIEIKRVKDEN